MDKVFMLLYLLLVVDIIEKNQQKQTSYQAAAVSRRRNFRIFRPIPPRCNYHIRCKRYGYFHFCWWQRICTHWFVEFHCYSLSCNGYFFYIKIKVLYYLYLFENNRSSHPEVFSEIRVLKKMCKSHRKHLERSIFSIKCEK